MFAAKPLLTSRTPEYRHEKALLERVANPYIILHVLNSFRVANMRRNKHCKWSNCTSDSRYVKKNSPATVYSFRRPYKDFKLLQKDPTPKYNKF